MYRDQYGEYAYWCWGDQPQKGTKMVKDEAKWQNHKWQTWVQFFLRWNRRDVGVFKYLYSPNKHVVWDIIQMPSVLEPWTCRTILHQSRFNRNTMANPVCSFLPQTGLVSSLIVMPRKKRPLQFKQIYRKYIKYNNNNSNNQSINQSINQRCSNRASFIIQEAAFEKAEYFYR